MRAVKTVGLVLNYYKNENVALAFGNAGNIKKA